MKFMLRCFSAVRMQGTWEYLYTYTLSALKLQNAVNRIHISIPSNTGGNGSEHIRNNMNIIYKQYYNTMAKKSLL